MKASITNVIALGWLMLAGSLRPAAAAPPAPAGSLRLGYFPNLTHAQALLARAEGGLNERLGATVEWSSFNAGPTAIEAIFTDAVDATFVGPSPAINGYLRSRGEKFVVISGAASGGSGLVVRDPGRFERERGFDGAVIATPQLGNTQDIAARTWFTDRGYRFRDKGGTLALLALSNPDQLTLFKKGEIEGAWTVEPWLARLEVDGGGKLVLDERTLWPEGRYATTLLIMNRDYLATQPALVRKLLTELVELTRRINDNKTEAGRRLNAQLKKETGKMLPDAVIERAISRIEFTWDPIPASLQKSAEAAHRVGFIRTAPDLKGLVQLRPLNDVLRERGLAVVPLH